MYSKSSVSVEHRWMLRDVTRSHIDRRPLAKIISFCGTHVGNTWFMIYLKDI